MFAELKMFKNVVRYYGQKQINLYFFIRYNNTHIRGSKSTS